MVESVSPSLSCTNAQLSEVLARFPGLIGSDMAYGQLISRHLFEQADFMPYRSRLLVGRWAAWTGT